MTMADDRISAARKKYRKNNFSGQGWGHLGIHASGPGASEQQLEDRERRRQLSEIAEWSGTLRLGDPVPGYSAKDRKEESPYKQKDGHLIREVEVFNGGNDGKSIMQVSLPYFSIQDTQKRVPPKPKPPRRQYVPNSQIPSQRMLDRVEQSVPISAYLPAHEIYERSGASKTVVLRALVVLAAAGRILVCGNRSHRSYRRLG